MPAVQKKHKPKYDLEKIMSGSNQFELEREQQYQQEQGIQDHLLLGRAVALAQAAEAHGQTCEALATSPEAMEELKLFFKPTPALIHMAHKFHRDHVEAALYRASKFPTYKEDLTAKKEQPVVRVIEHAERNRIKALADQPKMNKIFGHFTTNILKWLGKNDVTKEGALKVLARYNTTASALSLDLFLKAGKTGSRGPAPELTEAQAKELLAVANS